MSIDSHREWVEIYPLPPCPETHDLTGTPISFDGSRIFFDASWTAQRLARRDRPAAQTGNGTRSMPLLVLFTTDQPGNWT
jgi:hypothetical protein